MGDAMARLIDQTCDAIQAGDPEAVIDGLQLALSFIEHARGQIAGLDYPEVVTEPASAADLESLRHLLTELVRTRPSPAIAGLAVFALGKLYDPGLTEFFVQVIRDHLHGDAGVLYQAMIALDNLGANVFAGRQSMSIRAEDENGALAADFVRRADLRGR
jgi:hypothetical protein